MPLNSRTSSSVVERDYIFKTVSGSTNRTGKFTEKPIEFFRNSPHHARKPGKGQLDALTATIRRVGFVIPVLAKIDGEIVDGHTRVQAARALGFNTIPVIIVDGLNEGECRALALSLNRLAERGEWDKEALRGEFTFLFEFDASLTSITGFEAPEIDGFLTIGGGSLQAQDDENIPDIPSQAVTKLGDLWICGDQKVLCGNARESESYRKLLGFERAKTLLTDPPYGCAIKGHVSGTHGEFVEGSGYSDDQITTFLTEFTMAAREALCSGAMSYLFIDAAGMYPAMTALRQAKFQQKALCVWDKQAGGMGSLYRQQAEFIIVAKWGKGAHTNNVQLGTYGRNRTTVWSYPGLAQFGGNRSKLLAMHPTVKPVGLLSEAILDASGRGDIVLDPFVGSGTTLLAAHRTGRRGRGLELDPKYVDVAVQRLQEQTGLTAVHATSGRTFTEMKSAPAEEPRPTRVRHRPLPPQT